jgi:hypothetical protein
MAIGKLDLMNRRAGCIDFPRIIVALRAAHRSVDPDLQNFLRVEASLPS